MTGLGENNFFSKCENQITKCVFPLENLQGMNYIALTINVGSVKKKVVRAYNRQVVFQAKTLQTDADIDDYVEKIRSQLKQLLKNCDEIKLN